MHKIYKYRYNYILCIYIYTVYKTVIYTIFINNLD